MIYLSSTSWDENELSKEKSRNTKVSREMTASKQARDGAVPSHGVLGNMRNKRWGCTEPWRPRQHEKRLVLPKNNNKTKQKTPHSYYTAEN